MQNIAGNFQIPRFALVYFFFNFFLQQLQHDLKYLTHSISSLYSSPFTSFMQSCVRLHISVVIYSFYINQANFLYFSETIFKRGSCQNYSCHRSAYFPNKVNI